MIRKPAGLRNNFHIKKADGVPEKALKSAEKKGKEIKPLKGIGKKK